DLSLRIMAVLPFRLRGALRAGHSSGAVLTVNALLYMNACGSLLQDKRGKCHAAQMTRPQLVGASLACKVPSGRGKFARRVEGHQPPERRLTKRSSAALACCVNQA